MKPVRSYDVYDTCLSRVVAPETVFKIIEERTGISGFADARIQASIKSHARKTESTIEDIYAVLFAENASLSIHSKSELISRELETENELTIPIKATLEQIRRQRVEGCEIWFISDMYLPDDFIKGLLQQHGFFEEGDACIVSCEVNKSKRMGTLFADLKDQYPTDSIHYGDNPRADYIRPESFGIDALLNESYHPNAIESSFGQIGWDLRSQRLQHNLEKPFNKLGLYLSGPIANSFLHWLYEFGKGHGIEVFLTISREGNSLSFTAQELGLPAKQLDTSRLALFRCLCSTERADFYAFLMEQSSNTLNEALTILGWEKADLPMDLQNGYEFNHRLHSLKLKTTLKTIFSHPSVEEKLELYRKQNQKDFVEYWDNVVGSKIASIGLIDVGWNGTIQKMLEEVLRVSGISSPLRGYYLCCKPQSENMHGYFSESFETLYPYRYIIEQFFASECGQTIAYENGGPIYTNYAGITKDQYQDLIEGIQKSLSLQALESPTLLNFLLNFLNKPVESGTIEALSRTLYNSGINRGTFLIPRLPSQNATQAIPWPEGYIRLNYPNLPFYLKGPIRFAGRIYRTLRKVLHRYYRFIRSVS